MKKHVKEIVVAVVILLAVVIIVMTVQSCTHDGCEPDSTRCNGSVLEICDAEDDWFEMMNCAELYGTTDPYVCCWNEEYGQHECLLPVECDNSQ